MPAVMFLLVLGLVTAAHAEGQGAGQSADDIGLNFTQKIYVKGTGSFVFQSAFRALPPPRARPPPFRRPPPSDRVASHGVLHTPDLNYMHVVCPKVVSAQGYPVNDPRCGIPEGVVAEGTDALALRASERILNGDEANIVFEVDTLAAGGNATSSGGRRRRGLLAGSSDQPAVVQGMKLSKFTFSKKGQQKEIFTGKPIDLRTIVYLIDIQCGNRSDYLNPIRNASDVYKWLFPSSPNTVRNNLQNYYSTCSYGKVQMQRQNTVVLGPLPVACRGTFPVDVAAAADQDAFTRNPNATAAAATTRSLATSWDFTQYCGPSEQRAWQDAAEAFAQKAAATDPAVAAVLAWTQRRRSLFLLPPRNRCPWQGLADVTCTQPVCSAFLQLFSTTPDMQVMYHELMHNMGLNHATLGSNEYGDSTDVMGNFAAAGSGLLCHNAPYMYRIGWAKPINGRGSVNGEFGNLTAANFTTQSNVIEGLRIPAQGTTDENMVVVALGAKDSTTPVAELAYPTYFLSYRIRNMTAGGYDSGLNSSFANGKITIHEFNGEQNERDQSRTRLVEFGPLFRSSADLRSWRSEFQPVDEDGLGGAIQVTIARLTSTYADIDLCRVFGESEADLPGGCADGVDNDCDGMPDDEDPDCQ
ncbi:hypothetical protein HXX76_010164 [Chlamydomonas incerta]|uniref:Peptidase M11 gametolysin domain-containing protein n=1 Tax=Chlamydomonas incerta TaxID=51695 RepID=A0A835VYA0_CHLIN|nr:hypothetical protein HXX76_010164 [Chlamydomonas incerta]|eukprot:KAG2430064.1 hypothetical protein HXX76_010164 [Chlamydomonas incerta]